MPVERESVEKELITSPLSSAGSYSTASSRSTISLSSEQLEAILAANSKSNLDSSAKMMESNQKAMMELIASLSPVPSSARSSRPVQVKPPRWSDEDTPYDYFAKYEKAMTHNGLDKAEWGQLLPVYLAGKAQAALAQVNVEDLADYELVKTTLLDSLEDTPASADRKWWSLSRLPGEEPGSFYLRIRAIGLRRFHGLESVGEVIEKVILSRYMSLLPADCYAAVAQKQPKTGLEASRMVLDYEETKAYARKRQPWKDSNYHSRREPNYHSRREPVVSGGNGSPTLSSGGGPQNNFVDGTGQSSDGSSSQESMGMRPVGRVVSERKQVICHGCGELGHIRPNCPNRIRRIVEKDAVPGSTVDGFLAGEAVKGLKVDTGSGRTLVHKDYIPRAAYTGKTVVLDSWRGGQRSRHRLARITIKVDDVEVLAEVVVVDTLECPALLGTNLGSDLTVKLIGLLLEAAKLNCEENVVPMQAEEVEVNFVRATEAQVDEVKVEEEQDAITAAPNVSKPLSEIFNFSDELFVEDPIPILVKKQSQIIEDQTDKVAFGQIEKDSVELGDIFGFTDSFFVPDSVLTPVPALCPKPEKESEALPCGGRIVSKSDWQPLGLTDFDSRFMHLYAKATRELTPDWVASIDVMLFLFLRVLLCVLSFLHFLCVLLDCCFDKFFVSLRMRMLMPSLGYSLKKRQWMFLLLPCLRQPEGGGDVMRALLPCSPPNIVMPYEWLTP